ncbi:IS110 family transposase [Streptomyces sp. NBC_01235]|uniref:IS110 family transposase n=1 Tax=Streptomyces sp. NBC_01235 TaxID=2903788 RepID=UPI002E0E38B6|nr:IS110 family transposase [Streptomyces sp. NBC_01235]
MLATDEFPATAPGYRDLLKWARKSGTVGRAGVEGTGSYGASLSRYLLAQGVDVFDVNWMDRADRRRRGKSDPLDAQNAARAVLSGRARARALLLLIPLCGKNWPDWAMPNFSVPVRGSRT